MKKQDYYVVSGVLALVAAFFAAPVRHGFETATAACPYGMAFVKFAVLSTFGECLGLRLTAGVWNRPGFGIAPRALVWGVLGVGIAAAFTVFSSGVPALIGGSLGGPLAWSKVGVALAVSVAMNTVFAPIFMTMHRITDMHIAATGGTLKGFFSRGIDMAAALGAIDWRRQWGFVFARTIPLFWYPAHTITFLLPPSLRVVFAAFLGVVLGVLLSLATRKK